MFGNLITIFMGENIEILQEKHRRPVAASGRSVECSGRWKSTYLLFDFNKEIIVGDLNNQSIKEVLNSDKMREIQNKHKLNDFKGILCEKM